MDNLSPTWAKVEMSLQKICNGDIDRPLIFEVWDWDSRGKHVAMGDFTTSVREIADNGAGHKFAVKVSLTHDPDSFLPCTVSTWLPRTYSSIRPPTDGKGA